MRISGASAGEVIVHLPSLLFELQVCLHGQEVACRFSMAGLPGDALAGKICQILSVGLLPERRKEVAYLCTSVNVSWRSKFLSPYFL